MILVTGATGHVGSEVVAQLASLLDADPAVVPGVARSIRAMTRRLDTVMIPFGTRPAAPIDPADVAAVAVAAFTSDRHRGAAYRLSGPQVLTPADELRILGETLGRSLRSVE